MVKYDDASWHYGSDFPADLPSEAGATHIGIFVAWCLLNGLAGDLHIQQFPDMYSKLRKREMTPGAWFIAACDEKFTDGDLSELGNAFAKSYYGGDAPQYFEDYEAIVGPHLESPYHVVDSWETFEKIAPVICTRFETWGNQGA